MDDEFHVDDQDPEHGGFAYGASQRNSIKNDLLNMIDDEPSETSDFDLSAIPKKPKAANGDLSKQQ